MHTEMSRGLQGLTATTAAVVLALGLTHTIPAEAKSKRYTVEAEYCKGVQKDGSPNPCAALVYGVGTSNYYVTKVNVEAKGTQQWDTNTNCENYTVEQDMDLRVTEYGVFVVPAPCSYKLTIKIGGGDSKGQSVFMSPGCELVLISTGTSLNNNKPKIDKVKWTDKAKKMMPTDGLSVSDSLFHQKLGQSKVHYCNKDDNADRPF